MMAKKKYFLDASTFQRIKSLDFAEMNEWLERFYRAAFVVMQTLIKPIEPAQADPLMSIIGAMMVNAKKEEDDEQTGNNKVPK